MTRYRIQIDLPCEPSQALCDQLYAHIFAFLKKIYGVARFELLSIPLEDEEE